MHKENKPESRVVFMYSVKWAANKRTDVQKKHEIGELLGQFFLTTNLTI